MKTMKHLVSFGLLLSLAVLPAYAAETMVNSVDLQKMTCKQLMAGSDADRDGGVAFFHGYMAGKKNTTVIELDKASALSDLVEDFCLSNPESTVMDAFTKSAK